MLTQGQIIDLENRIDKAGNIPGAAIRVTKDELDHLTHRQAISVQPSPGAISLAWKDGFQDASYKFRRFIANTLLELAGGERGVASAKMKDGTLAREPQKSLVEALNMIAAFTPDTVKSEVSIKFAYEYLDEALINTKEDQIWLQRTNVVALASRFRLCAQLAAEGERFFSALGPLTYENLGEKCDGPALTNLAGLRQVFRELLK